MATQTSVTVARRLRVLVLEPLELVREGIQGTLSACEDLAVAFEAGPEEGAAGGPVRQGAGATPPDVVLVGVDPSRREDVEAIRAVCVAYPGAPVAVLAQDAALDPFMAAVRAGARGYVLRSVRGAALADAVRAMAYGGSVIDPLVARRLLEQVAALPLGAGWTGRAAAEDRAWATLSPRELEVLTCLARGMSNKEIAADLRLSVGTVKTHLRHIFRKLAVADRTSAALAAARALPGGPA